MKTVQFGKLTTIWYVESCFEWVVFTDGQAMSISIFISFLTFLRMYMSLSMCNYVYIGGPGAIRFTHHGKPWLKHVIARHIVAKCYLSHDKNRVSLVRCPAWSLWWLFPECSWNPLVLRLRKLQRLLFITMSFTTTTSLQCTFLMTRSTSNIYLHICTCYKSTGSSCRRLSCHWRRS